MNASECKNRKSVFFLTRLLKGRSLGAPLRNNESEQTRDARSGFTVERNVKFDLAALEFLRIQRVTGRTTALQPNPDPMMSSPLLNSSE